MLLWPVGSIGGPTDQSMRRSFRSMSVRVSAGPGVIRAASRASSSCCAFGVNGGIRPSGGLTMIDVRPVNVVPRSSQKLL